MVKINVSYSNNNLLKIANIRTLQKGAIALF